MDLDADPVLGFVPMTNRSGCGSGMPKNIRILRIKILVQSHKEATKQEKSRFCLMMEGSGAGSRAGSILVTNGSGCGMRIREAQKIRILWIQIPNTCSNNKMTTSLDVLTHSSALISPPLPPPQEVGVRIA
jgi:hypothetical protein